MHSLQRNSSEIPLPSPGYSTQKTTLPTLPRSMQSRVYEMVERLSVRVSVCPIIGKQQRRAAGLLLRAVRAADIDRQPRAPSCNGAAARRSAEYAGSVVSTAEGRG